MSWDNYPFHAPGQNRRINGWIVGQVPGQPLSWPETRVMHWGKPHTEAPVFYSTYDAELWCRTHQPSPEQQPKTERDVATAIAALGGAPLGPTVRYPPAPPAATYTPIVPPRTPWWHDLRDGLVSLVGGLGGLVGAIAAIALVGGPCLAAGPIGWLAALFLVPPAAGIGYALGAIGFLVGVPLLAILLFALQLHH